MVVAKLKYMLNALHGSYCIDGLKYLLYWHSYFDSLPPITPQLNTGQIKKTGEICTLIYSSLILNQAYVYVLVFTK